MNQEDKPSVAIVLLMLPDSYPFSEEQLVWREANEVAGDHYRDKSASTALQLLKQVHLAIGLLKGSEYGTRAQYFTATDIIASSWSDTGSHCA